MKPKTKLNGLPREQLEEMAAAGAEIEECYRLLAKTNANVVGQCLANQGTFYEFDHYPAGDIYDDDYGSQYYYHSHREDEHGHFHTFLRAKAMPKRIKPAPYYGDGTRQLGSDALCHFVAISMDGPGKPIGLFTTNRWVTDETFYTAEDAIDMLGRFKIDHTYPCLAANRWVTAMLVLFRPQIEDLLRERDRVIEAWEKDHPDEDVYEDRDLEIISTMDISVPKQLSAVRQAIVAHGRAA